MPEPFEPLRETLLRAGIAPNRVRRYVRELGEHFSDLVGEELEAGKSAAEAQAAARARLGADEALAGAMLAQPALCSWTGRAPWATLVVGPFLLLILAWFLAGLGVLVLVGWPAAQHARHAAWLAPNWLTPGWMETIGIGLFDLVQVGGPLLIAAGVALLAARQRSRPIWPLLGCAAVSLFGASLVWSARWPTPGSPANSFSLGLRGLQRLGRHDVFSFAAWSHGLPLVAFSLAVAASVYWAARRPTHAA